MRSKLFITALQGVACLLAATLLTACLPESSASPVKKNESKVLRPASPSGATAWKGVARGVAWDANWEDRANWYGSKGAEAGLDNLDRIGVDWIAITPFSFQKNIYDPDISFRERARPGMDKDVINAHARGMRVMVKPHIWSNQFWDGSGHWRGHIKMKSDEDWAEWFDNYTKWIVFEAKRAEAQKADAFCVGLEYLESSRKQAHRWRKVIKAVREVYSGPITYGAHSAEMDLPFWDDLDAIGINAYFPVSNNNSPSQEDMVQKWTEHVKPLEKLARKYNRPVIFTEVGYASVDGAARAPYRWPNEKDKKDDREQADCYRALFDVAPDWPWFGGMFIWKYKITVNHKNPAERHYVFQGKEAERVIQTGFQKTFRQDDAQAPKKTSAGE